MILVGFADPQHQHENDILTAIDERFEELEDTIILASLVPQLHDRLFAVEQLLKVSASPLSAALADAQTKRQEEVASRGPQWGNETASPRKIAPPDGDGDAKPIVPAENNNPNERISVVNDIEDLKANSPLRRRDVKKITDISRSKAGIGFLFFFFDMCQNQTQYTKGTDAIVEGEGLASGAIAADSSYGFWVNNVKLLSDVSDLDLDEMVDAGNPECGDIGNAEPMINYLRHWAGPTTW
eukprot:Skav219355  [mRNA]  locus=scaffold76:484334:493129:- [translate_table: standard]